QAVAPNVGINFLYRDLKPLRLLALDLLFAKAAVGAAGEVGKPLQHHQRRLFAPYSGHNLIRFLPLVDLQSLFARRMDFDKARLAVDERFLSERSWRSPDHCPALR